MKRVLVILMIVFAVSLSGCSGNKAAELYETAQFEEKQNNQEHAGKLYEEIVKKYPESEYAKKAGQRLVSIREKTGRAR